MQYWTLNPPARWQAGTTGAERTPFYFSCADCGEKDAKIAGIISTDGTFSGIGLLKGDHSPFVKPAMFCTPCLAKRLTTEAEPAKVTTVDELAAGPSKGSDAAEN
jgi:hypothetical protein